MKKDINNHESDSLFTTDIGELCSDCYSELLQARQDEIDGLIDDSSYDSPTQIYLAR